MSEVTVRGLLRADGSLELAQPVDLPPGEVRVIVRTMGDPASGEETSPANSDWMAVLRGIWAERRSQDQSGRTSPEIDSDIERQRDEWEERQQSLDTLRQKT